MKLLFIFIAIGQALFLSAQQGSVKEVHFEAGLTWNQVKAKAKQEGKYIFVDYFATWCAPCKQMDKLVYTSENVAAIVNSKFISVKVQMDTTTADDYQVKRWHTVAHSFRENYKINEFPTFLFFSPEGKIVHRESGFKMPDDFIKIISDAIEPERQLYTQLEKYRKNIKDYRAMPSLAKKVHSILNDYQLAFQIADDYSKNYLNKLSNDQLLNKDNIEFISWYPKVLHTNDKYFNLFLSNTKTVDSLMGVRGFSSKAIDGAIISDEIFPNIYRDGKPVSGVPDWGKMLQSIRKKYGVDRAERTILDAKIGWYTRKKEWDNAIKYEVIKIERNGIDTSFWGRFFLNNLCYDLIFKHSNDKLVLNKAINWMKTIIENNPTDASEIDTYAQLLYKSGQFTEAIKWQEKAITLAPDNPEIQEHLEKMKRKEPTWLKK